MNYIYRAGGISDLQAIRQLAIMAWSPFQKELTQENWVQLSTLLSSEDTYLKLLKQSQCLLCETDKKEVIGMAFLIPSGNPTDIYDEKWSYIRFVSVNPLFAGGGIGRKLTEKCISLAKQNKEETIALHTSEMMENAIHIYENLGFKVLREIAPSLGKRYWLYKLDLEYV